MLLKVTCPAQLADIISCTLVEEGSAGVEERDAGTMSAAADKALVEIIAGFENDDVLAQATSAVRALPILQDEIQIETVEDAGDDWKTKWREFFEPQVLSMLQIITPWMSPPRDDRVSIVIDPGQAFGTGGHATTKLILEMMEQRAKTGALPRRAADIGAGSGILSIAARKLGVDEVIGVDVEEEAVTAFFENAERNGVQGGIDCRLGSTDALQGTWPLLLANIQIDVFRIIAKDLACLAAPGAEVLLSGILLDQVDECIALWPGFEVTERRESGEWAALALKRVQ